MTRYLFSVGDADCEIQAACWPGRFVGALEPGCWQNPMRSAYDPWPLFPAECPGQPCEAASGRAFPAYRGEPTRGSSNQISWKGRPSSARTILRPELPTKNLE